MNLKPCFVGPSTARIHRHPLLASPPTSPHLCGNIDNNYTSSLCVHEPLASSSIADGGSDLHDTHPDQSRGLHVSASRPQNDPEPEHAYTIESTADNQTVHRATLSVLIQDHCASPPTAIIRRGPTLHPVFSLAVAEPLAPSGVPVGGSDREQPSWRMTAKVRHHPDGTCRDVGDAQLTRPSRYRR